MTKGMLPPSNSPGWRTLARGQKEGDTISRCPGGHIHLDYGNLTLRLDPEEFLGFAEMVSEAASLINGGPILSAVAPDRDLSASFSLN